MNHTDHTSALAAALVLLAGASVAHGASIPLDFATTQGSSGLYYQLVGDSRPSNVTNASNAPLTDLAFSGSVSFSNGSVVNQGPGFQPGTGMLPYVMLDSTRNVVLLHPLGRLGESNSIGAATTYLATTSSLYSVSGTFARANNYRYAGDGVDVAIAKNGDLTALLFEQTITADHDVNADAPFSGTGVAPFAMTIGLSAGDRLSFVVLVDGQGTDQDFDVTALEFNIAAVPEPSTGLMLLLGGLIWILRRKANTPGKAG